MSREDDERFWNLVVFKVYATDKELEEMAPALLVVILIAAVVVFGFWLFSDHSPSETPSGPPTISTPH